MPWQAAPPLVIIAGAFSAAGGLFQLVQLGFYGKDRSIGHDQWSFSMEKRDIQVMKYRKMMEEAGKKE
eukprot:CAMPEP_0171323316 /NCGR_PEP_ID=MMETSP0816-20121228/115499_1 /TAXON_ID=420281 /ORGANISM="Proboscia inermis, Strain CCAP1064/1" /LENGTH=67 /DNA_ID=CAMNT_0011821995 /DNA_START=19 /DNA_END=222 /DNA_ORIENTATION=-